LKTLLCSLAEKHGCDKTPSIRHSYTPLYHQILSGRLIMRVLEIGVGGGASMKMWRDYFPEAEIFGIDNDPIHIFNEEHIHTTLCDASDTGALEKVAELYGGNFDMIIDDGSHYTHHQISSFKTLLHFLSPNGIYIIEDVLHIEDVSNNISHPHEIHCFNNCSNPSDDNMIVFFNK
jgi:trans-aconitate methyltransferase